MMRLPPPDAALHGLPVALDGSAMVERLRSALAEHAREGLEIEACHPEYVRYKPGTSCLVGYRLRLRRPDEDHVDDLPAHVQLYADDGARRGWQRPSLRRLLDRARQGHLPPPHVRAALLEDVGGLLQIYPVDRDLPALVRAAAPRKMGRLLGELLRHDGRLRLRVEIVRYRPGRKALLRYQLRCGERRYVYAKAYAGPRAAHQHRLSNALAAAGVPVPPVLGTVPQLEMVVHAAADGRPLLALRDVTEYASPLRAAAETLARLHGASIEGLRSVPADHDASLVRRSAETLAVLLPEHDLWIHELAAAIAAALAAIPERRAPIHGDFYDDQVLVSDGRVTLLDFDEARLGNPLVDVGNFLAHVSAKLSDTGAADAARETFRAAYLARCGGDARTLALFEACAMLQLAVGPFRRLQRDWPDAVLRLLRLAEHRLTESCPSTGPLLDPALPHLARATDGPRIGRALSDAFGASVEVERTDLVRHKPG
ncbi:MAG: aminoglycoside phosphotransferase family protein, partial [Thermoleophilaceae bacterium]